MNFGKQEMKKESLNFGTQDMIKGIVLFLKPQKYGYST